MKLVKLLTLAVALNSVMLPAQSMHKAALTVSHKIQPAITIAHINTNNVKTAQEAYAFEAQWSPTVRYVALGTVAAIVAYTLYLWSSKQTPVISTETYHNFEQLAVENQKALVKVAGEIVELQARKGKADALAAAAKSLTEKLQAQDINQEWVNKKLSDASTALFNTASSTASSIAGTTSSILTYGIGATAATTLGSYAYGAVSPFMPRIPTAGNLQWFITNRTDYERNVMDIQRYFRNYAVNYNEICDVMQLMVYDLEKIVAYLQHFNENISSQAYIKAHVKLVCATCQRYTNNIIQLTHDVVDALNAQEDVAMAAEKLGLMLGEVNSAKIFVNTYHI